MEDLLRIPFVFLAVAAIGLCYLLDQKRRDSGTEQDKTAPRHQNAMQDQNQKGFNGAPPNLGGAESKSHNQNNAINKPEKNSKNKNGISIALTIGLIIAAIAFAWMFLSEVQEYVIQYFKEPFPDLESAYLLKHKGAIEYMGLGLIYGAVLYGFYRFVLKHDHSQGPLPKLMVVVWVTLIVVLTGVGLFKAETKTIMASIKRLETPAGAIEFANTDAGDDSEISISYPELFTTAA